MYTHTQISREKNLKFRSELVQEILSTLLKLHLIYCKNSAFIAK